MLRITGSTMKWVTVFYDKKNKKWLISPQRETLLHKTEKELSDVSLVFLRKIKYDTTSFN